MNNHTFISLQSADGTDMEAYVAMPEAEGSYPGILLLQEAFGVNNHIRDVAERIAREGYVVIAPDLFHRTAKRIELPYDDFAAAMPHYQAIIKEGLSADLQASYDWLQQQPNVVHEKVGSIGFCLGGRVSFLANAVLPLSAAVSYYGGGIPSLLDEATNLHATHLFFWGGQDKHIPQEQITSIISAVRAAGKQYINVEISYADHGFHCDERGSYSPDAAKEAWAMTLAFFQNKLR
ncbi:dienelactone hydrolase family protein [Pontibacter harenae]|uniref:dienelactone hydrolase family protein n=1 Tax=Pontibacter harenae TaxID=2894083 RepID=UPI001E542679|nr:dienelactone hydrolase family protein [Pontibacter harenae]MCC9168702.1 dienelactone hydrolase family protein [Pontibacter harenae]